MEKTEKLYNEILDMIYWAEEQKHINHEQKDLLIENINKIKNDIDRD